MTEVAERPLDQQLQHGLEDLQRKVWGLSDNFASGQQRGEKEIVKFEQDWKEKLKQAGLEHVTPGLADAVDAIRTGQKLDTTFTMEMRAEKEPERGADFKLTPDLKRRLANFQQKERDSGDLEMD